MTDLNHLQNDVPAHYRHHGPWPDAHIRNARNHVSEMFMTMETLLRIIHPNIGPLHP